MEEEGTVEEEEVVEEKKESGGKSGKKGLKDRIKEEREIRDKENRIRDDKE